jgi:hypothetical protein
LDCVIAFIPKLTVSLALTYVCSQSSAMAGMKVGQPKLSIHLRVRLSACQVSGVARIEMRPLIGDIPIIGAMTVSLRKPPLIHFQLTLGKAFGGSFIVKPILAWLDPFLRNTLTDMLVW